MACSSLDSSVDAGADSALDTVESDVGTDVAVDSDVGTAVDSVEDLPADVSADLLPDAAPGPSRWEKISDAPAVTWHTATLLKDGRVLITGGEIFNAATNKTEITAAAHLFDPTTETFTSMPSMSDARSGHTATLLKDGRVLVAGGSVGYADYVASVEIFDPSTETWASASPLPIARQTHAALLLDGEVVVIGGSGPGGRLSTIERYDPVADVWNVVATSLHQKREAHTMTLLASGKVLVAGGSDGIFTLSSMEVYDPATGTVDLLTESLSEGRLLHTATALPDGRVVIVGGFCGPNCYIQSNDLYDPVAGTVSKLSHYGMPPSFHAAALLNDGRVLISGGADAGDRTKTVILTLVGAPSWASVPHMFVGRYRHTLTRLLDGTVLAVGGEGDSSKDKVDVAERFYP